MPTQYYPTLNPWQQLAAIGSAIGRNVTGAMYDQPQQRFQNAMTLQQMADRQALQQHQMAMQDAQLGLANNSDKRAAILAQLTLANQAVQQAQAENQLRLSQMAERGARAETLAPAGLPEPQAIPGVSAMPLSQMGPMLGQFGQQAPMMTEGPSRATLYRQLEPQADIRGAQAGLNANTFGALQQRDAAFNQRDDSITLQREREARLQLEGQNRQQRWIETQKLATEKFELNQKMADFRRQLAGNKQKLDKKENEYKELLRMVDILATDSTLTPEAEKQLTALKDVAVRQWIESQSAASGTNAPTVIGEIKDSRGNVFRNVRRSSDIPPSDQY